MSISTALTATPLRIGPYQAATPVVLAPMAGVTNAPFRRLCREYGGGFYVSEMVTSRALVERSQESMRLISFDEDEHPRSVQLYGVDPATVAAAVRMLVDHDLADHIDLNFGCPVAKVTRKGGGAALPWKSALFMSIVRSAVSAAAAIPVTVKMRKGIDGDHLTYLEAGLIAEGEGVAALALHARTAAELYSGQADWSAIARLKETVTSIPVLGNGDIWSADDALEMMRTTGCDGVVVGRGCLGRPWLFAELDAAFVGHDKSAGPVRPALPARPVQPALGDVVNVVQRHATLLVEHFGDELRACRDLRKHISWYFKGYTIGGELRTRLVQFETRAELNQALSLLDPQQTYPGPLSEGPRGRKGFAKRVTLPEGWLDGRDISAEHAEMIRRAEASVSGG